MPLLFSYGTLQLEAVQLATFRRRLEGQRDELAGAALIAPGERLPHANVVLDGREDSRVAGTALLVSEAELEAADKYERSSSYARILVTLVSGRAAWVYRFVDDGVSAP